MQEVQDSKARREIIRSMVRSTYDLQKLRVTIGNRIGANFRSKLGVPELNTDDKTEQEAVTKKILDNLVHDYEQLTKINGMAEADGYTKMPTVRKFKPHGCVTNYAEMSMVKAYVDIYRNEESQFASLKTILQGYPLYDNFLSSIDGLGPQLAAIIISEIDWHKCTYPSSLWKYAGVDVVRCAYYLDDSGSKVVLSGYELDAMFEESDYDPNKPLFKNGKQVFFEEVGRSRKKESLVLKNYTTRDGDSATRPSISFNPFLKTKLIGVLGTSFIRTGTKILVDGKRMGTEPRKKLAKQHGHTEDQSSEAVIGFLMTAGHTVEIVRCKYSKVYIDYRNRLDKDPRHQQKSTMHKHNMAVRYMVKRFLVDLYEAGRISEGLPVMPEYAVAKLGLVHGQASEGKLQED